MQAVQTGCECSVVMPSDTTGGLSCGFFSLKDKQQTYSAINPTHLLFVCMFSKEFLSSERHGLSPYNVQFQLANREA